MPKVTVYLRPMCPFCHKAEALLKAKNVDYERIDIWSVTGAKEEMVQKSGGASTVPQIFIDQRHIGGCTELMAIEESGQLDQYLSA